MDNRPSKGQVLKSAVTGRRGCVLAWNSGEPTSGEDGVVASKA